jgi:hypothetical protein
MLRARAAVLVTTTTLAFSSILLQQGCKKPDTCEQAFARLARIAARRGEPPASEQGKSLVLESCRSGKATMDPVLRCAIDSSSDDEAAACIERGIKDVVKPGAQGGAGVNPLLDK